MVLAPMCLNTNTKNSLHERGGFEQENNTWIGRSAARRPQNVSNGKFSGGKSIDGEGVNLLWTISGIPWAVTSTKRSGFSGVSYSTPPTPASPLSSPLLARAYTFLRSVPSACSSGVATWMWKTFAPVPALWSTVCRN